MIDGSRRALDDRWTFIAYNIVVQQCMATCWLAPCIAMPASVASITTMVVPVGGVLVAGGLAARAARAYQIAALICVVGSVAMAVRS